MEIPVMTSASTHGLRSAVGACAKPTSSFLNSSDYPGGCLKKIINTVNKSDGSSFLNKLSFTKKRKSTNECGIRCKKNKNLSSKAGSNQSFTAKGKNGRIKNVHIGCYREELPKKYANVILNGFPKRLNCSGEFLPKIKSNDLFDKKVNSAINEAFFNPNLVRAIQNVSTSGHANCSTGTTTNNNNNNENIGNCNLSTTNSAPATTSTSSTHINSSNDTNNNNSSSNNKNNKKSVKIKKNISNFGAVGTTVHSISISDVTCRPEKCGDGEVVSAGNEGDGRDGDGTLTWQPKHLATRRTSQISREVLRVWQARFGSSSSVTTGQVPLLLNDLQLLFPKFQVHKALESAGGEISFEELCRSLAEGGCLKFCDTGISRSTPSPRQFGKNGSHQHRKTRKLSKTMCKYEVFLGGSCNPTTWRTDIAIPDLQEMGITFFNPQVSQWQPSLLEVEYDAKENADVMFFVIDNQTRGVSTLIEVAHLAGSKRNLILVIQSYTQEKQMICGEVISQQEYKDLRNAQEVLRDLVESQGTPVFDNIRVALKCTERLLRKGSTGVDDVGMKEPPKEVPVRKAIEPREAFDALVTSDTGKLTPRDACLALELLKKRVSVNRIEDIAEMSGLENKGVCLEEQRIDFEQFCSLVDAVSSQESEESFQGRGFCIYSQTASDGSPSTPFRDVFLGGTHQDTRWKEDIAIPMLKNNGLTYFNPSISEWSERFLPIEAAAMKKSYILLLVISNSARSVAEMAVAGHYIGLGARMVLCVEKFPSEAVVGGDTLSENAVKDYNRGRMYLMDIAERNGVKTFSNVAEAVECVVDECKQR